MILRIGLGSARGYLFVGKYYSNGKTIRLIKEIGHDSVTYVKIMKGVEVGVPITVTAHTMETWAKWPVFVDETVGIDYRSKLEDADKEIHHLKTLILTQQQEIAELKNENHELKGKIHKLESEHYISDKGQQLVNIAKRILLDFNEIESSGTFKGGML